MRLFARRKPMFRLAVFMKSGNSFTLDGVASYEIKNDGNRIVGFSLAQPNQGASTTLLVKTIDLDQIEAVLRLPN